MNDEQYRQLTRQINRYTPPVDVKRYLVEKYVSCMSEIYSTVICYSDLKDFNPGESPKVEVKRVKLEDVPDILCRETLVTRPPTLLPLVKDENTYSELLYVIFYVEKFHTYVYFYRCYETLTSTSSASTSPGPPTILPLNTPFATKMCKYC
ncbi:hypothetical protein JTB14_009714 [Gonioctena quinquepunctata]|nr:hypothetical protein JTB14_009714 [Gonioctena quinquepunctata]